MTNNGHHNGQYFDPSDPHAQQAGADGRVRAFGMGTQAHGLQGGSQSCPDMGQGYGQMPPYAQSGGYAGQGRAGQSQGHSGQSVQSGQPGQPYGYQAQQPYGQQPYQAGQSQAGQMGQTGQMGGQAGQAGQTGHPYGQQAYGQYGQPAYAAGAYVQPATSQPVQVKQKRSRRAIVIAIIVALVCIALAVTIFFLMQEAPSTRQGTRGQLEGKTDEEIQAELDRQVEEGMFNISIASVVEFENGDAEGELRIENVPGNKYLMQVNITRDDTGDVIYTTDMIEPDYHVQRDSLDVSLPAGTYPCTAVFSAYDPDTEQQIGQAAAKITVQVKS